MKDITFNKTEDILEIRKIWAKLFVHIKGEILSLVCYTERFGHIENEHVSKHLPFGKQLCISGLYIENYRKNQMYDMAVRRGSIIESSDSMPSEIMCRIYANDDCDKILIDFCEYGCVALFRLFYNAFQNCMDNILEIF